MPKIYRVMAADGDRPRIGDTATTLGVRVPRDIAPDSTGTVHPGTGGMSVSPTLLDLPPHRIPRRLQHLVPDASGKDDHHVWRMGEGEFVPGPVASGLQMRLDPDNQAHGLVEPDRIMDLESYRRALSDTQPGWRIDEE